MTGHDGPDRAIAEAHYAAEHRALRRLQNACCLRLSDQCPYFLVGHALFVLSSMAQGAEQNAPGIIQNNNDRVSDRRQHCHGGRNS